MSVNRNSRVEPAVYDAPTSKNKTFPAHCKELAPVPLLPFTFNPPEPAITLYIFAVFDTSVGTLAVVINAFVIVAPVVSRDDVVIPEPM